MKSKAQVSLPQGFNKKFALRVSDVISKNTETQNPSLAFFLYTKGRDIIDSSFLTPCENTESYFQFKLKKFTNENLNLNRDNCVVEVRKNGKDDYSEFCLCIISENFILFLLAEANRYSEQLKNELKAIMDNWIYELVMIEEAS